MRSQITIDISHCQRRKRCCHRRCDYYPRCPNDQRSLFTVIKQICLLLIHLKKSYIKHQ